MVQILKTYEETIRGLKDYLIKEMHRYVLPHICAESNPHHIDDTEFQEMWDTYTRPLLFDIMSTPLYDLGFQPYYCPAGLDCRTRDNQNRAMWAGRYFSSNDLGRNDFLDPSFMHIPYSGPYEDLSSYTPNRQYFNSFPWYEDDEMGNWVPPWIDVSGVYHPGFWTGQYDIDSSGDQITAHVEYNCQASGTTCLASRIYRHDTVGTYRDFIHEFEYYNGANYLLDNLGNPSPNMLIYGLYDRLSHGFADMYQDNHLGLWSVPTTNNIPGYLLKCMRDDYYSGNMVIFGYGAKYCDNPDINIWKQKMLLPEKELKITVERRGEDVIFIFWRKRVYMGDLPIPNSFCSFPWPLACDPGGAYEVQYYWPGAGARPYFTAEFDVSRESTSVTGSASYGFWVSDTTREGDSYWIPFDLVYIRLNPADSFDYLYSANYPGWSLAPETYLGKKYAYTLENLDLYEYKISNTSNLFIDGGAWANDTFNLHAISYIEESGNLPLYLSVATPENIYTDLYVFGATYDNALTDIPLYIMEREYSNNTIDLFMSQMEEELSLDLYIYGIPNELDNLMTTFVYDLDGLEDFTTYTMVDDIAQVTDSWTYTRLYIKDKTSDGEFRWYKDQGDDFFNNTWALFFEFEWGGHEYVDFVPIAVSNSLNAFRPFDTCTEEALALYYNSTSSKWVLEQFEQGDTSSGIDEIPAGVHYHCMLERRGTASGGYEYRLGMWRDPDRGGAPELEWICPANESYFFKYSIVGWVESAIVVGGIDFTFENLYFSDVLKVDGSDLYIKGLNDAPKSATLYIIGWAETNNTYTTLHTWGGTDGWYYNQADIPLFIKDYGFIGLDGQFKITLFLYNDQTHLDLSDSKTLYIDGDYHGLSSSIDLTCFGLMADEEMTLFITTDRWATRPGYYPDTDTLPLYLNRPDESDSIDLVIYNEWFSDNTYISLHTNGVLGIPTQSMDLVLPEVVEARPNTYTSLYIQSGITLTGDTDLAMPETLDVLTDNLSLVCHHGGGLSNSYITCYINGVLGIPTAEMTLAIPASYGKLNDDFDLITKGY